jgi:hypothetical protein
MLLSLETLKDGELRDPKLVRLGCGNYPSVMHHYWLIRSLAGLGCTLLAARALGYQYLGIELDAKYHAIACDRLAQARQRTIHD